MPGNCFRCVYSKSVVSRGRSCCPETVFAAYIVNSSRAAEEVIARKLP
ncbi:hypothetical protein BRYFOR_07332 [Marvinbryantia formatexigens DSM 14469]|uniref:Uncharacterized protein n=1 Tax=Marvinbryantia formatexigens DSM 14469 TaxID=478749 RepID=C6LFD0_9FIRM|nr:hypothetical protein BRYFOR_07332 [Marvinbryantia formatexigens DSM 14469]